MCAFSCLCYVNSLERLEEQASGIFITLCNHSFHCSCLAQWNSDSSCPVCRYTHKASDEQASKCDDCDTVDSLWICLICGHVGCSRYRKMHAQEHWKSTGHTYSLELDTQRVWDYAGDGYVHRLIQNKSDGKVWVLCLWRTTLACACSLCLNVSLNHFLCLSLSLSLSLCLALSRALVLLLLCSSATR